ncbi:MAG TPA: hypothetical protein DD412_03090 [Holosporales bacterium]|nr:hypothetical protein [Holosporales bacterium]
MSITTRFCVFFFTLFFFTTPLTFASSSESSFAIPEDIREDLTRQMKRRCPHILCGDKGHYLRSTTPDEYLIINAETVPQKPYNRISDWFMSSIDGLTTNCVFALCAAENLAHPVVLRTPEEESVGLFFAEFVHSFFDSKDNFLGMISVEPHRTTGTTTPHINYYILKEHQGKKYSSIMISGFVAHLKGLKGKKLSQMTLPKSAECLEILRNTLSETPDLDKLTLSDVPSSLTSVGPICAHVPLENPSSFVPASKALFFTGRFHLAPSFSEALGSLVEGITKEETRAVGIHLIFSSEETDESAFSPLRKKMMLLFKGYCLAKRDVRPDLYPTLRDTAFAVVDEEGDQTGK